MKECNYVCEPLSQLLCSLRLNFSLLSYDHPYLDTTDYEYIVHSLIDCVFVKISLFTLVECYTTNGLLSLIQLTERIPFQLSFQNSWLNIFSHKQLITHPHTLINCDQYKIFIYFKRIEWWLFPTSPNFFYKKDCQYFKNINGFPSP